VVERDTRTHKMVGAEFASKRPGMPSPSRDAH
jgi:hypothetical protein